MAITTKEMIKNLYSTLDNVSYDDRMDMEIKNVALQITNYCNKNFVSVQKNISDFNIYKMNSIGKYHNNNKNPNDFGFVLYDTANVYESATVSFDSTGKTITSSSSVFGDFITGDNIMIVNSYRNNGYFTIDTVTNNVITVTEDLKNGSDEYIYIYMIDWPYDISMIAARMVGYNIQDRNKRQGLKSENIGTYSYSMQDVGGISYPTDIVAGLSSYRTMRVK